MDSGREGVIPLDERIQKLFESGWVNEFNYLENQLQEARYLLACLNEKYNQLTNNWNELEEDINNKIKDIKMNFSQVNGNYFNMNYVIDAYEEVLDRMKEIEEGKNVSGRN